MDQSLSAIELYIKSRYPIIYVVSWEEDRVEKRLGYLARIAGKDIFYWCSTLGILNDRYYAIDAETKAPFDMFGYIQKYKSAGIFVLRDFHAFLDDARIVRGLRDMYSHLRRTGKVIIILSSVVKIPGELEKDITVIDYELPDKTVVKELLKDIINQFRDNAQINISISTDKEEELIDAALGLTLNEIENAFTRAIVRDNCLGPDDIEQVLEEKKQIIRKSRLLEYYEHSEDFSQVGGLRNLKEWLVKRKQAFSERAEEFGLPQPKGILLLGVQGCGKSLIAKTISHLWRMPLLKLDMGSLFSSYMGSSEENLRKAIKTAETISPCIMWIDELEKSLAGVKSSSASDAGTTARMVGSLLTWLQEKSKPVFVVATANDVTQLPPELLRKGRFDEIFFVDLPGEEERREIFEIHLKKRRRDPLRFDLKALAIESLNWSGAEIEQAVVESLFNVFIENRDITDDDIMKTLKCSVPLSTMMKEEIDYLRNWARERTRPAS